MIVTETGFRDLLILEPTAYYDERGYFMESYNRLTLEKKRIYISFVQDNQSYSKYGVLRGLHFQKKPFAQTKLVRALTGRILDVVVDLRADQPTFNQTFTIELSEENKKQLFVPQGFAHGFVVLSETAYVLYKCDEYYNKGSEAGIRFDDPELAIDWNLPHVDLLVSSKDVALPYLNQLNYAF